MPRRTACRNLRLAKVGQYCELMSLEGWQPRLTRVIAREIRRHRDRRKMSAQQLADRTAELGMPIPRPVLANLESGRRDSVSAAELLILAAALDVAPMELICPVGYDDQIELLPGRTMDPLQASRWFDGRLKLDATRPKAILQPAPLGEGTSASLAEQHAALLNEFHAKDAEVVRSLGDLDRIQTTINLVGGELASAEKSDSSSPRYLNELRTEIGKQRQAEHVAESELSYRQNAADRYRDVAVGQLRFIRAEMRRRGMTLPPLPPSLKEADDDPDAEQ